jgi:hypothetical protein
MMHGQTNIKAKFQLEVTENEIVIPPVQVYGPLKSIRGLPLGSVDPRLRTAVLSCDNGVLWQYLHASVKIAPEGEERKSETARLRLCRAEVYECVDTYLLHCPIRCNF